MATVNVSKAQVAHGSFNLGGIAAAVLGAIGVATMPPNVRSALVLIGGALLSVAHAKRKQSPPGP